MFTKHPTKIKSPSGIIIIAVLTAAYLIFASTTPVQGAQWFYQTNLLPPENGMYNSEPNQPLFAIYPSGIVIRNFSSRQFTLSVPPPSPGVPVTFSFNSKIEMEISYDGGTTYWPIRTNASNTMQIKYQSSSGGEDIYQTEMLLLSISGGDLPAGVMIRESPMLSSIGQMHIKPVPGGYMISSFFDIYTEISTDFGGSWWPSNGSGHVELLVNPETVPPMTSQSELLPPPVANYVTPAQYHQAYANGIIIKDVKHKLFTQSIEPPALGATAIHTFDSQADFQASMDGGLSFMQMRAPAHTTVRIEHTRDFKGRETYETEMTELDISGGDLPSGVKLRESPTKASQGGTSIVTGGGGGGAGGGAAVSSFFDIWTEVSTDGGMSWWPSTTGPANVEAQAIVPIWVYPDPYLPPPNSEYLDKGGRFAFYASGIVISNVHQHSFTASIPPPLPGNSTVHAFGSVVDMQISMDGGLTFSPATAPANTTILISSSQDSGDTRYFDTEMWELDISGGSLPPNVMIRESPTRASLGRISELAIGGGGGGYKIESFFDIYTEVSTDGGMSWYPTFVGPATVYPRPVPCKKCSDLDDNKITDMSDLGIFVANWLWTEPVGQTDNVADLNCDEKVNFKDYAILAEKWLQDCP
ncbi:MAG: hypothetical protein WAK60_00460 [Sedimentisphaerales bacterium]